MTIDFFHIWMIYQILSAWFINPVLGPQVMTCAEALGSRGHGAPGRLAPGWGSQSGCLNREGNMLDHCGTEKNLCFTSLTTWWFKKNRIIEFQPTKPWVVLANSRVWWKQQQLFNQQMVFTSIPCTKKELQLWGLKNMISFCFDPQNEWEIYIYIRINLNMKSLLLILSGFWLSTHIHIVLKWGCSWIIILVDLGWFGLTVIWVLSLIWWL